MAMVTEDRDALPEAGTEAEVGQTGSSAEEARGGRAARYGWAALRLLMGWTFFWAFIDKLFGLGFATPADQSWLNGGSPTFGFLTFDTRGPFAAFYQGLAGNAFVDALFMAGLAGVGLSLLLGIGVRVGAASGTLMLVLMYTGENMPPENNPFVHDRLVYAVIMIGLMASGAGETFGLGRWWARTPVVRRLPVLK